MNRDFMCQSNRDAWNEVMPLHRRAAGDKLDEAFSQRGYSVLDSRETEIHHRFGLEGRAIAHLCCNNGQELMSLKNLGAGRCVGFDISSQAIDEARNRAERCSLPVEFVCADVYQIESRWFGLFDKVYLSVGCLGWMPDLLGFFRVCRSLLKPRGHIFIHEIHPIAEALPCDGSPQSLFGKKEKNAPGPVVVLGDRYFRSEPCVEQGGLDYVGATEYDSQTTQYWFVHTVSVVLMALKDSGFQLDFIAEYPEDISGCRSELQAADTDLPLSWILVERAD